MATLENLLKNAVYDTAKSDATLWAAIDGRLFFVHPQTGASKPYVLYSFSVTSPKLVWGISSPPATGIPIYFDIYSSSEVSTEAESIQGYIHDAFDSASISMTGYGGMAMRRGPEIPIYEEDTGLWHINITYYAIATKS